MFRRAPSVNLTVDTSLPREANKPRHFGRWEEAFRREESCIDGGALEFGMNASLFNPRICTTVRIDTESM